VQLRSAVRFPIRASVVFTWQGAGGPLRGEGVTRDISRTGVYVHTPTSPPLAVPVQMEIFLPPMEPQGKAMKVLSEGPVIRVEQASANEAQGGFAVSTLLKVAPLADGQ
jgi:PilZ domain